jgi:hypothetical protein
MWLVIRGNVVASLDADDFRPPQLDIDRDAWTTVAGPKLQNNPIDGDRKLGYGAGWDLFKRVHQPDL